MKKILAGILLGLLACYEPLQAALTFSGGTTHALYSTAYTANTTNTTWSIWLYRTGAGGASFGRIWFKGTTVFDTRFYNNGANYLFDVECTTTDGQYGVTRPSDNVWHHFAVTYTCAPGASGSTCTTDPIIYIDGTATSLSVSTDPAAGGTISNNTEGYSIGNFMGGGSPAQNWGGSLAEFAVWDTILTAGEIGALSRGVLPVAIRLANLKLYFPLTGLHSTAEPDYCPSHAGAGAVNVDSATRTTHGPPIQTIFGSDYEESIQEISAGGVLSPLSILSRRRRK